MITVGMLSKFGRLTVIADLGVQDVPSGKYRKHYYLCECTCGATVKVVKHQLTRGLTKSCGCLFTEKLIERNTKHGLTKHPLHGLWQGMISRCTIPSASGYHNYGGRGIKVCAEWRTDFSRFLADVGERPNPTYTLDRIDNNGDYSPENCRWASPREQAASCRRACLLCLEGVTAHLAAWARAADLPSQVVSGRLRRGWSIERALTQPRKNTAEKLRTVAELVKRVRGEFSE